MKNDATKNLKEIATLENGRYRYRWSTDVVTIQEAYEFLDIWDDNLVSPIHIQESLISTWDEANRCSGWATAIDNIYTSPALEIDWCCWIDDPDENIVHLSMEARLDPKQI